MLRRVFHAIGLVLLLGVSCHADLTLRYTVQVKLDPGASPAPAGVLEQQLAAGLAGEKLVRIKGTKSRSRLGLLEAFVVDSTLGITILNPAAKQYARLSMDEYIAGLQSSVRPIPAELLDQMKFDVQNSKTGQVGLVSGIRAEEHLTVLSISVNRPDLPAGPVARVELHIWLAIKDELDRIPALRQYAEYAQRALNVASAAEAVDKLFSQLPGVAEKLRALTEDMAASGGSLAVKTQESIYMIRGGSSVPMMQIGMDLAAISADAIDDSVFEVPPDYQLAPGLQLVRALLPPPATPGQPAARLPAGVSAPVAIFQPQPKYTKEALAAKLEGTVTLSVVVDKEGNPRNVQVLRSLGMGLDEKAIEAVSQWRFRPGQKNGQPVNVKATVLVNFKLLAYRQFTQ